MFSWKICDLKHLYFIKIILLEDLCPKIQFFGYFCQFYLCFCIIIITLLQYGRFLAWFMPIFKSWNPVFWSRFSKSAYLEPATYYVEFLDIKIFPDKLCPVSGFASNWIRNNFLMVCKYKELTWIIFNLRGNTIACC